MGKMFTFPLPCLSPHSSPNHTACKAAWAHTANRASWAPVRHPAPGPRGEVPVRPGTAPRLSTLHVPTAALGRDSVETCESSRPGTRGRGETGQKLLGISRNKASARLSAKHPAVHLGSYQTSGGDKTEGGRMRDPRVSAQGSADWVPQGV